MDNELYQTKVCTTCKVEKALKDFYNTKGGTFGKRGKCVECYQVVRAKSYAENKDARNAKRREYNSRPEVRQRRIEFRAQPEVKQKEKLSMQRYKNSELGRKTLAEGKVRYQAKPEARAKILMASVVIRCNKSNLPLEITQQWILDRILAGKCELTGIPFDLTSSLKTTRRNGFLPSIDQIDAGKGYTLKNSRVVLVAVNLAMCEWGLEQFLKLAQATLEFQGYKVTPP